MAYNRHLGYKKTILGEDTKGHDFKAFGDTTGKYIEWDASADTLTIAGTLALTGAPTIVGATSITGALTQVGNVAVTGTLGVTAAGSATAQPIKVTATSASTNGSSSIESMLVSMTMSGAGGVGGRARFALDTNVALGSWANALKGITTFGASGSVTGMGSAVLGELVLSAGTTGGTYAPLESELVLGTGAKTGTASSFLYMNASGAAVAEFDTYGYLFEVGDGITIDTGHMFAASAKAAINATHAIRIRVKGVDYFIPCHTSVAFGV